MTRKARLNTSIRFPVDLHAVLSAAAEERDVSLNYLVVRAVEAFLPRLLPAEQVKWTK